MVTLSAVMGGMYVGVGVTSVYMARYGITNREKPGSTGFIITAVAITLWGVASGVNTLAPGFVVSLLSYRVVLLSANLAAVGWLLLALEVTDRRPVTRRLVGILLGYVALWQLLIWTNPWHHFVLAAETRVVGTSFTPVYATGFWLYSVSGYLLIVVGTLMLAVEAYRTIGYRRRQTAALALGVTPPLAASVISIADLLGTPYDLTPFGYLVTEIVFVWALYEARFLDIVPVARQTALEEMEDAVLTLDADDRVVDYNAAAAGLFEIDEADIGKQVGELVTPYQETASEFIDTASTDTEISISDSGETRHFHLTISPLGTASETVEGRIVVLRDVTALKRREEELDLMRQVQSRVLRHNIRNDLQVVKLNSEVLADELEGQQHTLAERTVETADDLMALSAKAQSVEQLVDQDGAETSLELGPLLADMIDRYRSECPDVDFELDCPSGCRVNVSQSIDVAFENIVENAAQHNDAGAPSVSVRVEETPAAVQVTVSDNGPGIPRHELAVLEEGEETPLEHGSGLGLWVVQWVVDSTGASITYDTGFEGTEITIRIPR